MTWVGFKALIVERFVLKYYKLHEKINFIQMRYTGSLKAYVHDSNTQMNVTPKINKFRMKTFS